MFAKIENRKIINKLDEKIQVSILILRICIDSIIFEAKDSNLLHLNALIYS